ncbi:hypothetical protein BpHYR1_053754 [Brachionus plicatilis]|uniref:Uncharacterized protein n=1 Tax=Brachionus plicatilis TaxID=10195 RepID=A0A3M7PKT7_BRAPC|nr:hypothetical protein BpHYR1_053754 [Brachionus plicatilis]
MVQMRKKIQKLFAALSQASLNVDPFGMNFTFIIRLNFLYNVLHHLKDQLLFFQMI